MPKVDAGYTPDTMTRKQFDKLVASGKKAEQKKTAKPTTGKKSK